MDNTEKDVLQQEKEKLRDMVDFLKEIIEKIQEEKEENLKN